MEFPVFGWNVDIHHLKIHKHKVIDAPGYVGH